MRQINRRDMALQLAGATLALGCGLRKPNAQTVLTPSADPVPELHGMDKLMPTDPPAAIAPGSFTDEQGAPLTLAGFAGKGVVLNMWATWCVPCVAEMPALNRMAERLAADGVVVLPLSSDRGGAAQVRKFYTAHGIDHLGIYLDKFGLAAKGWGARGLPTTIIIDRAGLERGRFEGGIAWDSEAALATIRKLTAAAS